MFPHSSDMLDDIMLCELGIATFINVLPDADDHARYSSAVITNYVITSCSSGAPYVSRYNTFCFLIFLT